MPGIFSPVSIEGVPYIDGGISNNVPVGKAVELGAHRIYLLNVSGATQKRELSRPHDFAMHGLVLARAQRYRLDIEHYRERAQIIEFPPADVGHVAFTNLSQTARLIEAGFTAGLEFLRSRAAASGALVQKTG
jgi:NTE family protein